jgi:hypothetical protein
VSREEISENFTINGAHPKVLLEVKSAVTCAFKSEETQSMIRRVNSFFISKKSACENKCKKQREFYYGVWIFDFFRFVIEERRGLQLNC